MAIKGFADNPQQTVAPNLTDWLGIQQGTTLADMKKITYEDLMEPMQVQVDALDTTKADKDADAVAGNFAYFDGLGNPVDSGHKPADYEDADPTILKQANVVDNLISTDTDKPLSANQGKVLKDEQDAIKGEGWTNETVKGNADAIALKADQSDVDREIDLLSVRKNMFNKATVTFGYYINWDTGALITNAYYSISDFIPVHELTQYIWVKASQQIYYDSDKNFISGQNGVNPFVTPANCRYVRLNISNVNNIPLVQLEIGGVATSFEAYNTKPPTAFSVKTSGGDFTSIQDAIDASIGYDKAHAKIYVFPGTYTEELVGKKYVDIIGVSRDTCIIASLGDALDVVNHDTIIACYDMEIKNLTITGEHVKYCIHADADSGWYTLKIINCVITKIKSNGYGTPLGIGLHYNQNLFIENCIINGDNHFGIYVHNKEDQIGACRMEVHNSQVNSATSGFGIQFDSLGSGQTDLVILTNNKITGGEGSMRISRQTYYGHDQDDFVFIASGNQIDTVQRINGALTSFSQPIVSETVFTDVV